MNGDTFYVPVGGGAGYGDALERDPQAVMDDLRNGLPAIGQPGISIKLCMNEKTLRLYPEETEKLKAQTRRIGKKQANRMPSLKRSGWHCGPGHVVKYYAAIPIPLKDRETSARVRPAGRHW